MSVQAVLLPVFVLVALVFAVLFGMGARRMASLKSGETRIRDIAAGQAKWSVDAAKFGDCYKNQFEIPVLFYALVAIGLPLRKMDLVLVLLSWVFVVTRFAHAGIFVTTNNVKHRSMAWIAGVIVLLVMWVYFALRMLLLI